MAFTVEQIVRMTDGQLLQGDPSSPISMVHFDSRKIEPQGLFIALTRGARDGHIFLHDALDKGAGAALISKPESQTQKIKDLSLILVRDTEKAFQHLAQAYRQQLEIPVIAVTGSNGKTTTKDMLAHLLAKKLNVFKTYKNLNNHLGLPLSLLQIKQKHEAAVLEMGMSHPGEIDFLAGMAKPTISIITNIGDAHIEYFGSQAKIAEAKGELLTHTDPDQFVLLNQDDPFVMNLTRKYSGRIISYSIRRQADVYATEIKYTEQGTIFKLHIGNESVSCLLPMFGRHNVSNLLPGAFIAHHFGCTLEEIKEQLLSLKISDMRFQIIPGPGGSILINDAYNASPTSMKAAIDTFSQIYPQRKKVVVLGDMFELGEEAERLHAEIGYHLQKLNMTVLTIGRQAAVIADVAGGMHAENKREVIEHLEPYLNDAYAILFKASRGMALEEVIRHLQQTEAERE